MGKYAGLAAIIAENMIEGSSFKANGETVTISEEKMKKATDALSETVRGMMRDFWTLKESEEGSLEHLDGEVKIEELMDKTDGSGTVPSLGESLNFNIKQIVESMLDEEPEHESTPIDGDSEFQNASIGHDEAAMGGDLEQDGNVDPDAGMLGDDDTTDLGDDLDTDNLDVSPVDGDDDGFSELSFADLESAPADEEFGSDMSGDEFGVDDSEMGIESSGEAGEAPIGGVRESAKPLAKMKGGSKAR